MRSFSKKLASVLALAMVVTVIPPSAEAKAAEKMAINKSSQILYVNEGINHKGAEGVPAGKGNVSVYDFYVKNKPEDWKTAYKFAWSSSNEDVLKVEGAGVATAVSAGTANVICKVTEKATGDVQTLKTKVTVKANAAEVVITNADDYDGTVVEAGDVVDLNRAMYDENGNKATSRTKGCVTDYTRWIAEFDGKAAEGVKITQSNGKFEFTEDAPAGEYKLYCETYQSSKYTDTTATSNVVTVVIEDAGFEADQTGSNKVDLVFGKAANVAIADVTINKIIAVGTSTGKLPVVVSGVSMSEDKKTATISTFSNFDNGATYEISVKGYDEVATMVAKIGKPSTMTITSKSDVQGGALVYVNSLTDLTFTLFDEFGNDITNKANANAVVYSAANATTADYYVSGNSLYIYKEGEVAVNAEYHTGEYDANGNETVIKTTGYFVGITKAPDSIVSVTLSTENQGTKFANNQIPVSYGWAELKVNIKTTKQGDNGKDYVYNEPITNLDATGNTQVQFRSSNPDVLDIAVGGNTITLFKEGTSAILIDLVTYKDGVPNTTTVAAAYVTVLSKSVVSAITVGNGGSVVVGTVENYNTGKIDITAKDQYGAVFTIKNDINQVTDTEGTPVKSDFEEVKFVDGTAVPAGSVWLEPRSGLNNWQDKVVVSSDIVNGMLELDDDGNPIWMVNGQPVNEVSKRVVVKTQPFCDPYPYLTFTFNVTVKKPVSGAMSYSVEASNTTSGNVGRYVTSDTSDNAEAQKTVNFKVMTKSNGITTGQANIYAKPEGFTVPSWADENALLYSVTHDGTDITALTTCEDDLTVALNLSDYSAIPDGATVSGSAVSYTKDYKNLGAGTYVFTVYQVKLASDGVTKSYAYVGTTSINVTCDTGSYSYVKRTAESVSSIDQVSLRNCFEINGTNGQKTTNANFYVDYTVASTSVHVKSITFYEALGGGVYAPYTVNINVSLKK